MEIDSGKGYADNIVSVLNDFAGTSYDFTQIYFSKPTAISGVTEGAITDLNTDISTKADTNIQLRVFENDFDRNKILAFYNLKYRRISIPNAIAFYNGLTDTTTALPTIVSDLTMFTNNELLTYIKENCLPALFTNTGTNIKITTSVESEARSDDATKLDYYLSIKINNFSGEYHDMLIGYNDNAGLVFSGIKSSDSTPEFKFSLSIKDPSGTAFDGTPPVSLDATMASGGFDYTTNSTDDNSVSASDFEYTAKA